LKKFIKREERVYWAICGKAKSPLSWDSYKSYSPEDLRTEYTLEYTPKSNK
jgi:hypothetical protein